MWEKESNKTKKIVKGKVFLCMFLIFCVLSFFIGMKDSLAIKCFLYGMTQNYKTTRLIETKDENARDLLIAEGASLKVRESFDFVINEESVYVMLINKIHIIFLGKDSYCIKVKDYLGAGEQMKVTILRAGKEEKTAGENIQGQSFYISRSLE